MKPFTQTQTPYRRTSSFLILIKHNSTGAHVGVSAMLANAKEQLDKMKENERTEAAARH